MDMKETLIFYRRRQGLSQIDLADALSVSRQTVSKWETGAVLPSAENLLALSRLYGIPVDALLNGGEAEQVLEPAPLPETVPPLPEPAAPRRKLFWRMLAVTALCDLLFFFVDISWYSAGSDGAFNLFGVLLRLTVCCAVGLSFARWDRGRPVNKRAALVIGTAALALGLYVLLMPTPLLWRLYSSTVGPTADGTSLSSDPIRSFAAWALFEEYAFFAHTLLIAAFQLGRLIPSRSAMRQPEAAQI